MFITVSSRRPALRTVHRPLNRVIKAGRFRLRLGPQRCIISARDVRSIRIRSAMVRAGQRNSDPLVPQPFVMQGPTCEP